MEKSLLYIQVLKGKIEHNFENIENRCETINDLITETRNYSRLLKNSFLEMQRQNKRQHLHRKKKQKTQISLPLTREEKHWRKICKIYEENLNLLSAFLSNLVMAQNNINNVEKQLKTIKENLLKTID